MSKNRGQAPLTGGHLHAQHLAVDGLRMEGFALIVPVASDRCQWSM